MPRYRVLTAALACAAVLAHAAAARAGTIRCPPETGTLVSAGWKAYRADSIPSAAERFARADRICPAGLDAKVGLGFAWLRLGMAARAESLFTIVVVADSAYADGWQGLMFAARRTGHDAVALSAARTAWRLAPGDADTRAMLDQLAPAWERPARAQRARHSRLIVQARTHGERFEVPAPGGWRPFFVKGVNLGVALPGRFPAEFPLDSMRYAGWLDSIAAMNANAVRVYTILPPAFYRALAAWNVGHPDRQLWLIHGVWAELPEADDFDDPSWKAAFRDEMRDVLGVIHGDADIAQRPGHAHGRYDADVSRWTLAYIIGREWEPFAVAGFESRSRRPRRFAGRFLTMADGSPMEGWTAEQCDWMLAAEVRRYNTIRPIAYTNWPTLDPLHHPTEASTSEERAWRARVGRPIQYQKLEYDNDVASLDAARVRPTPANPAGWFASYHAYPYYPDFMLYDPDYSRARSSEGASNYFGYLGALRRHLSGIPLLIAEYGVPSSRGLAHLQPQGWTHGGHDEAAMAAIDARMTREIRESGCAGAVLFAWIDEWFKKNWAVIDLEIPLDHTPRWHNRMDAEQNYGVIAMDAGPSDGPVLGGDPARWLVLPTLARGPARPSPGQPASLGVGHDASHLYLAIAMAGFRGRALPWDSLAVQIAIDTHRADLGQHVLPGRLVTSNVGFEFLVDLRGEEDAHLLVTPGYDPYLGPRAIQGGDDYGRFYHRPATTVSRDDGVFDSMYVIVNRARFGRDGTFFPAQAWERGRLRYGREARSSLSDWYYDAAAGLLEVRIPWALLNVTDPSSATVLDDRFTLGGDFGTTRTDGFRIGVLTTRRDRPGPVVGALPALGPGARWRAADFRPWTWATWEEPVYHARLKPVFESMKEVWRDTGDGVDQSEEGTMIAAGLLALAMMSAVPDSILPADGATPRSAIEGDAARADAAWAEGRDDDARVAYRQVLSRDPRSVRANHRLALLLSRIDQLDSALVLTGRARALEPTDPGILMTEARLLSWAGRLDESIAGYDVLLALEPGHREARLGRSRVLGWAGRYAAADSMYAAMLAADPNDIDALTGRAQNAAWRGQLSAAEAGYVAATRLDADNVDALLGLARLRHDQGRQRSAAEQVSRALSLDPGSRPAQALRRRIRAARRPQVDLAFTVNQDSDHNTGWSRTFSTSIALADGLRGSLAGGSLAASDPLRDARRTLGEVGLDASHGRAQVILAGGTRWLDDSSGPARAAATYRSSLSYRFRDRLGAGVGIAHYPMDETALLIGSDLQQTELQASVDAEAAHGFAISAGGGEARLSDGNRRASGLVAVMRPYGPRGSVGVLGRVLAYQDRGVGYFSPDRFTLAEARGTVALNRRAWSGRFNAGLGVQQVGAGAAGQLAWRAAGQLRFGWAVIDHVEGSLGASNSAASSTTGAFRYLTAGVSLRLGL